MDANRFDSLTRSLTEDRSRRTLLGTSLALAGVLAALGMPDIEAKKKKHCPPCKKRKHGKCKKHLPDGTACAGGTCQGGSCVACVPEPLATTCAGASCGSTRITACGQTVTCLCPNGQTCLANGSCALPCTGACPAACEGCAAPNAEGQQHCIETLAGPCVVHQTCSLPSGTSGCPKGSQCQPCNAATDLRCLPLCTG